MKTKIALVIVAVAGAALAVALFASKKVTGDQLKDNAVTILEFSNQLIDANESLDKLQQVNLELTNDLAAIQQQAVQYSNSVSGALASAKASLQSSQDQIANLNGRVADLEAQNKVLDDRATTLTNTILALNAQITDTERRLANSETNNAFLEKELQRQIAQRADLERKFDDLNELRAQIKKLRDELFVSRRLQLMRNSATELKGAQLLVQSRNTTPAAAAKPPPHYDLNVEVGSDGSVHVIPPPGAASATNSPAP